jgi:hypothetical protein
VVQARGFAPRSSGNRPDILLLDEAWVLVRARGRCVTLALRTLARWLTDAGSNHDLRIQSPRSFHLDDLSIGGIGRTRTSTDLRPRQAGYRLPNDPTEDWGDRSDSNRDYGVHIPACCRYTTVTRSAKW